MDEPTAQKIKDNLVDVALGAVRTGMLSSTEPPVLYHFTDCQGIIGILKNHCLWASLAVGMTDYSEVRYCVARAQRMLRDGEPGDVDPAFLARVDHFLDPANTILGIQFEFDPYVISFCARADLSVHWLHYGRAGRGCTIAFDVKGLIQKPFDLVPVLYKEEDQDGLIASVVQSV